MAAVSSATTIPKTLKGCLSEPSSPWQISPALFARISQQPWEAGGMLYKKCQILSDDPECRFILEYFHHQKPPNYGICNIYCIHTPHLSKAFEAEIEKIDIKAKTFKPEWDEGTFKEKREKVIERWKEQVNQFYPISIQRPTRKDTYFNVRMLPLWHGTAKHVCHSIASTGFTYFGKHHFFNPDAQLGTFQNVDAGYYGSGVYFTNSAKYAAMYSTGNLLLAWVAMKEPFPVINDIPHPRKGKDMGMLEGHGAYQAYNAHYIPVAPISTDSDCMEYYPCYDNQAPVCDELVVFQEAQTLPRFWVEIGVDFPTRISPHSPIPGAFIVDMATFSATISPGLSIAAKCSSATCNPKHQNQWVSLGMGLFNIAKVYYSTPCPSCKIDFNAIDHFILHNATYTLEGRQQAGTLIKIANQKLPAHQGIMISQFSGWKYLNITLN